MCHLYEYYYFDIYKNWEEAQAHCRDKHVDLATMFDASDVERLRHSAQSPAWIGLRSHPGKDNRVWHWSMPGVKYREENWADNEPNDEAGLENCGAIDGNSRWFDFLCSDHKTFFCYNGENIHRVYRSLYTPTSTVSVSFFFFFRETTERLIYVDEEKTWYGAQDYCREHHVDLASGVAQLNGQELQISLNGSAKSWIGLFRDTWRFIDGSNSSFRNWEPEFYEESDEQCAVMNTSGKWYYDDCMTTKPFFCYSGEFSALLDSVTLGERNRNAL